MLQATLSLKLVRSNTAFRDEALYVWSGHLEWARLLHGAPLPPLPTYFSGAPVFYPLLAAAADNLGGLTGARLLSLGFMLVVTSLLWSTAGRLYGKRASFLAVALFIGLGPTIQLGAFATYDAMSLCLVAASAWCLTRAGNGRDGFGWICLSALSLILANATKYASTLFDPVIVAMAILTAFPQPGGKNAYRRGAALGVYVTAGLILLLTLGGSYYEVGVDQTTLTRIMGTNSPEAVLKAAAQWVGIIAILAALGALTCVRWRRARSPRLLLPGVFLIAVLLAPAEQARIHTLTSLDKHSDFGAWFGVIGAAYAIDLILSHLKPRMLRYVAVFACSIAVIVPVKLGLAQARQLFVWPNATKLNAVLAPLIDGNSGRILHEAPSVSEYAIPQAGDEWWRWSSTQSVELPNRHSISVNVGESGSAQVYGYYIAKSYFSVVVLDFMSTVGLDRDIVSDLARNHAYHIAAEVPYGSGKAVIWVLGAAQ